MNGLRSLGSAVAHGFSRPRVPLKSAVATAARGPSAPQHPRRGTASAQPGLTPAAQLSSLRSRGEGGDTKAPRRSQSDVCFLGRRGYTTSGADGLANPHREVPGNSGSCSHRRTNAANFCKRILSLLAIPDESDSPESHYSCVMKRDFTGLGRRAGCEIPPNYVL